MTYDAYLAAEVQNFIEKEVGAKNPNLAFQKNPFPDLDWSFLLAQIEAKQRMHFKTPSWVNHKDILFPRKISLEQSSSEKTAIFKASLMHGKTIVDLSGGMGIDCWAFSDSFEEVHYCEMQEELCDLARHNFKVFSKNNIQIHHTNSTEWLKQTPMNFDVIYVDPSRRNDRKGKVFKLDDCEPNALELQEFWLSKARQVFIKTSPLLDLHWGFSHLKNVSAVHIISVKNEIKELLWVMNKEQVSSPKIVVHELFPEVFSMEMCETTEETPYSLPQKYIYEPHAALMKTGMFQSVAKVFGVFPLHQQAYIYTSDEQKPFFGKCFAVEEIVHFDKKIMKERFKNQAYQIIVKYFPERADDLRKKWHIKESEKKVAIFTSNLNNEKIIILCSKFQPQQTLK